MKFQKDSLSPLDAPENISMMKETLIMVSAKWDRLRDHIVGANLMFALEQMSSANECSRANTRFTPTMWSRKRSHLAETMIKVDEGSSSKELPR
jgi:hypothetical protein